MRTCAACTLEVRAGAPFCPHCGAELPDEPDAAYRDPLVGRVLAKKFRVLSVLGEGGMGRVYKAEQVPLGVEVVIKTLHTHLASDTTVVKRFFREAQAASRLRHPNCIGVLDFGDDDGTLYIAMEFLRGRSLADVLEQDGPFSLPRLGRVIGQVLDVLETAHRMDIVHRDLKPENIMLEDLVTRRDFVKVLDFGIAKIVDRLGAGGTKLTQTGMVFGTPAYMAPEQASGLELDGRADIYAVGVMCFELLTGRLPFEGDSAAMLLAAHVTDMAPPILTIRKDLPRDLAALIDDSLAKEPARRPQTALEFKAALERAIESGTAPPIATAAPDNATRALSKANITPQPAEGFEAAFPPCVRCGAPVPPTAKFCGDCGAPTGRRTPTTGLANKLSDLRRFLPSGIVDELQQMGVRGAGEKREVVVLALDISGKLLDGGDPEADADDLGALYGGIGDLAVRHTGSVDRGAGDALYVVFGLTMTHADDAERAVNCALDVRTFIKQFNDDRKRKLQLSAAIHTGSAVVETTSDGPSFKPAGDTLSLPTRLAAAVTDKIVVSEQVRARIRGSVRLMQMAAVRLKGRAAAVATYEVVGARAAGSAPAERLAEPPLAGRAQQLDAILRLVDNVSAGHAVHVLGEPGSGKTRFLSELALQLTHKRHIAIQAPARPGVDRRSPTVGRIVATLGGTPDALQAVGMGNAEVQLIAGYLGQPSEASPLTEAQRVVAIVSAVRAAVETLAARTPVTVLVDDAHAADPVASELLRRWVVEPVPRVTVVTSSRPGYPLPWEDERVTGHLLVSKMAPLDDGAIAAIAEGALAPTPAPTALRQAVIERAGGSPLMALEVLRAMIDAGILTSVGGRWAVTGDVAQAPRPPGLGAIYAARIDALPSYARDVLACAAVIGNEFSIELLDHIIAQAHGEPIDREVHLLTSRGILVETEEPGRHRFAEQSCREAVYERLVAQTRQRLHHAVAVALEDAQGGAPVPEEVIGDHFARGGNTSKALGWYDKGCAVARTTGELGRAARVLRRALQVERNALTAATGAAAAELQRRVARDALALGEVLLDLGELTEIVPAVTEGLGAAHRLDDADMITRLRRTRGRAMLAQGDVDGALRELDTAMRGAQGLHDRVLLADLHADTGELLEKRGDLQRATEYLMRALELVQGSSGSDVEVAALRVLTGLGRVCVRNQDAERALRFLQQALTLAEQLDDKIGASKVLGNLAGVYHARQDFHTAVKFVERALELSKEIGDHVGMARQLNNMGTLQSLLGNAGVAGRHYDNAFAAAKRAGWREGMATAAAGRDRLRR